MQNATVYTYKKEGRDDSKRHASVILKFVIICLNFNTLLCLSVPIPIA